MDAGQFDGLTRSVASDVGTRRAVLRLLAGGALGGLVARLGLVEVTAAKKKHKKLTKKRNRPSRVERQAHGELLAEGKRKGKKHNRKPKNPPPSPNEPCNLDKFRCPDGTCVPWGTCCAGEKRCPTGPGPRCIPTDQCCPDERTCPDD